MYGDNLERCPRKVFIWRMETSRPGSVHEPERTSVHRVDYSALYKHRSMRLPQQGVPLFHVASKVQIRTGLLWEQGRHLLQVFYRTQHGSHELHYGLRRVKNISTILFVALGSQHLSALNRLKRSRPHQARCFSVLSLNIIHVLQLRRQTPTTI